MYTIKITDLLQKQLYDSGYLFSLPSSFFFMQFLSPVANCPIGVAQISGSKA